MEKLYTEPCGQHNQIGYEYFCVLGGLTNPKTCKIMRKNGSFIYFTYHLKRY